MKTINLLGKARVRFPFFTFKDLGTFCSYLLHAASRRAFMQQGHWVVIPLITALPTRRLPKYPYPEMQRQCACAHFSLQVKALEGEVTMAN